MPTSRNAKGVDIDIYSQDGNRKHTIQVKSLSKINDVSLGSNLENFLADYTVICWNGLNTPEIFVTETKKILQKAIKRDKEGHIRYWLNRRYFINYKDNWAVMCKVPAIFQLSRNTCQKGSLE